MSLYTTERDLREVFSKYGPIADVSIVYDQQSRRSRGFAFVYFENVEDAKEVGWGTELCRVCCVLSCWDVYSVAGYSLGELRT